MPNPSCSSPPQRLRHSIANTSAQPYSSARSSSGTRPSIAPALWCASPRRSSRDRSRPLPPIATRRSGRVAPAPPTPLEDIHALAGTRRLRLRITRPSSGRSKRARALACCSGSSGRNLSVSTPGGTTVTGSDRRPPARPRPQDTHRRRSPRRRRAAAPQLAPNDRQPPRHRHLRPWSTTPYGRRSRGPQTDRQRRVEHDQAGPVSPQRHRCGGPSQSWAGASSASRARSGTAGRRPRPRHRRATWSAP